MSLFDELREKRRQLASRDGVPPYCFGNDDMLREIVNKRPTNRYELLRISGFGEGRYDQWGREILRIVKKYSCSHSESNHRSWTNNESTEFRRLLAECKSQGFSSPRQLSAYICNNNLGRKYPNLTGTMDFSRDGDSWDMEGALRGDFYAALCEELGFEQTGGASPGSFVSYRDQGIF